MDNEKQTLSETPFWLNDWYVDPRSGRISRQGAEVKLEPKVMQVLVLLATNAGEVLSRELLESKAWDGVVVSYDSLSTTIIKLRKALGDTHVTQAISKRSPRRAIV
ncbi:MAG: winged helix-turn-helix domain-containing protein [Gammaproteobacteria bacterium]|nr:winged helix-turn-helix domain-containing protein [Gammaproteobacteria bacterium]